MGRTIGLVSLKGGVGKTTLATSLAADLAQHYNKKVLLVDANYSAPNVGIHMDVLSPRSTVHDVLYQRVFSDAVHERYGVDVIPGSFMFSRQINPLKLRAKLAQVKKRYDFVILDASPSLNDELFSTLFASDDLFFITTPDYATLSGTMKLAKLTKQYDKAATGIIVNRVQGDRFDLDTREIQASLDIPVVSILPEDKKVREALFSRVPMSLYAKRTNFSRALRKLTSAVAGEKHNSSFFEKMFKKPGVDEQNQELLRQQFYTSAFK